MSTVQWPHLSAVVCLSRGYKVPQATPPQVHLITYLATLGDPQKLLAACAPDQAFYTVHGLMDRIAQLSGPYLKPFVSLANPGSCPLLLRTGITQEWITPAGVLIPWPLRGDVEPEGALKNAYAEAGGKTKAATAAELDNGLLLVPLMKAADRAVAPRLAGEPNPYRAAVERFKHDPAEVRRWLVREAEAEARAEDPTFEAPSSFTVSIDDRRLATHSEWSLTGSGGLHLSLGWDVSNQEDKGVDGHAILDWPCGAYLDY